MRCRRQLRQNLLLHFAEQPRFMAYKLLQLTVEVRSSEGGLCMAAPLQRSGEYDVFLKMSPSAESRVQIPELRVPMSPQMPHGPLSKHAAPLPCTKHNHLALHSFTRYQPLISGCRVWKTLLSYSHDTSPSTAVCHV